MRSLIKYSVIISYYKLSHKLLAKSFEFQEFPSFLAISIFDQKDAHNLFPVELLEGLPIHLEVGLAFGVVDLLEVIGPEFAVDGLADFAFRVPALCFVAVFLVFAHDVEVYS